MFKKFRKAEKQICFEDFDKKHADLKIRLYYDGLWQNEFFRLMMRKYINKDENMMKIIDKYKEQKGNQSKHNRKKSQQLIEKARELENKFALSSSEIENMFDLLEKEHSDL